MNTSMSCRGGALLAAFVIALGLQAQTASQPLKREVVTLTYLKSEPGKSADYVKLLRECWKPIHQDVVNKGKLLSWRLYGVWPVGENAEYDFVSVMTYANFGDVESPYVMTDFAKVLGAEKAAELNRMNPQVRRLLRTDVVLVAAATDGWSKKAHGILEAIYMRNLPGKAADMLKLQREYYLPVHEDRIKEGGATGWATTQLRFPVQFDFPYDSVAFNCYENLAQIEKQMPQSFRDKWSAKGTEANALLPTLRKRVKAEIWRLVVQTDPSGEPPKAAAQ